MKPRAILFDLDDTLLGNDMEQFIPRYFGLLSKYAEPYFPNSKEFLEQLLAGTQAMIRHSDTTKTNRDVFWRFFEDETGLDRREIEPFFDAFYQDVFPRLRGVTTPRPEAAAIVGYCFDQGIEVAIATNPLFPRRAIEERLCWAGVSVSEYAFALVTTYENMHATKPSQAYYLEILERISAEPATTLMVGDDWNNDVVPATQLGIATYWIAPQQPVPPKTDLLVGSGTLEDFYVWLQQQCEDRE